MMARRRFNGGAPPAVAIDARQDPCVYREHTGAHGAEFPPHAVAVQTSQFNRNGKQWREGSAFTLNANDHPPAASFGSTVRRLTPTECERLQGFPDGHTAVPHRGKPMADGPRYRLLGNSMAVNVMRWIGERIALFERVAT